MEACKIYAMGKRAWVEWGGGIVLGGLVNEWGKESG